MIFRLALALFFALPAGLSQLSGLAAKVSADFLCPDTCDTAVFADAGVVGGYATPASAGKTATGPDTRENPGAGFGAISQKSETMSSKKKGAARPQSAKRARVASKSIRNLRIVVPQWVHTYAVRDTAGTSAGLNGTIVKALYTLVADTDREIFQSYEGEKRKVPHPRTADARWLEPVTFNLSLPTGLADDMALLCREHGLNLHQGIANWLAWYSSFELVNDDDGDTDDDGEGWKEANT